MKRIVYLASVLFLASSIISCQKELQNEENPINDKGGVTVNVVAGGEVESKTSAVVDGTTTKFKWTEGDDITLYEFVDGEQNEYRNSNATTISPDGYSATFKVTLEKSDPEGSNYVYTACHPAEAFTTGSSIERYQIPSTQNLSADGNFDPAADIMFGKSAPRNERVANDTDLGFSFKRLGTVVKLTLKGISSGEKINEISITAPEYIAGYCKVNFMTGEVGDLAYYGQTKTIKLNAESFTSDGEDVLWFRCIEGSWEAGKKFTIVIDTDKAGYTKEITIPEGGLEFSAGGLTKLTIGSLGDYREAKSTDVYSKVTSNPDDWSGEYLLVYENEGQAYIWTGVDASNCYVGQPITDSKISTLPTGAVTLTIATITDGYSIQVNGGDNNGKYIGRTKNENGMDFSATAILNTISIEESYAKISSSSAVMRYNATSGQDRFRYFKSSTYSGQKAVQLYKKKSTLPTINAKNINDVAATGVTDAVGTYSIENIASDDITITCDGTYVTSASKTSDGNFKYTVAPNYSLEAVEGTITFTSESGNVSKQITVSQLASVFDVEAENPVVIGNKAEDEGTFTIKSTFGGSLIISDSENFIINDTYGANEEGETVTIVAVNAGSTTDREATVTVKRQGQEDVVVNIKQNKQGAQPLVAPSDVEVTTYTTSKIVAEWTGADNASSYDWIISTCATAAEAESNNVKAGNTTDTSIDEAGTFATGTFYFYVRSVGDGVSYTTSDYASSGSFEIQEQHYLTVDFEKAASAYKLWEFTNAESQQTHSNVTAHGGLYIGTTGGKASASIQTKDKIANPVSICFFISKQSDNTTSSSWKVEVSSDNSSWTTVGDAIDATSMSKGEWVKVNRELSSYSNVYVKVSYAGSTAIRNIDDIELVYAGAEIVEPTTPKHNVSLGSHDNGTITATVGGQEITSWPASLEEDTVISLTATPNTGYNFTSWLISGASAASSFATTNITVGHSDITIGATFNSVGTKTEQEIYSTGFETSEGYTTSTYYQETVEQKDWKIYYGTISTSSAITGSSSLHMRLYSNKNAGYAITPTFSDATSISFNYQVSNKNVKFKVQISTDGGTNWTDKESITPSGTTKTNCTINFGGTLTSAKVKILVTDGWPSSSNYTFRIDDVVVKGMR